MLNPADKQVLRVIECPIESDGNGEKTYRCIGSEKLKLLDPFVSMDEYEIQLPHGFPDHPHRGFETVTYVLDGSTDHEDFMGNKATSHQGDVQFMVAGRGIVHTEMPNPRVRGLQLWINLPGNEKETEPSYLTLRKNEVSTAECDGVHVSIISGKALNNQAPMRTKNSSVHYYVFTVQPGASLEHTESNGWNCLAYVISGRLDFNGQKVDVHHAVVFGDGEIIRFKNTGESVAQFALLAGKPLLQPIVVEENVVVSSKEEVTAALEDFRECRNGFERAKNWKSVVGGKYTVSG